MKMLKFIVAALVLGVTTTAAADEPLDVTIKIVESPTDLPSAVTKTLELPPSASETARERSRRGLDRANEARALGREAGQDIAEEAKARREGVGQPSQSRDRGRP